MDQLLALVWLKWTLFRNAMRSRKAVLSKIASVLGTVAALLLALLIALGLGIMVYKVLTLDSAGQVLLRLPPDHPLAAEAEKLIRSGFLLLFMVFAILFLMWATVPLSLGGGSQFTPGRMLLYPVSLRKLFAIDVLSELTSLGSIFAIPIILSVALAAGLAVGNVLLAAPPALFAIACGVSIAKFLSTSLSALMQKRRTRGETALALVGVVVGLGGVFMGEFAAYLTRHGGEFRSLRWTPPGAAAVALTEGLRPGGAAAYAFGLLTLAGYTLALIFATYLIARRSALNAGGASRPTSQARAKAGTPAQAGWQLPLLSPQTSAVVEKELRYAMRNAQLRMMALMPLVLIGVRLVRTSRAGEAGGNGLRETAAASVNSFAAYADGLIVAAGILYVFLILSSLICNLFAYEAGGMRAFILAPVERRKILEGKNLALTALAFLFCAVLLAINQLVFRDLSAQALAFAGLSFLLFAACFSLVGNWLSVRFPKRLQFGKRMNASGVTGFLLIPIMLAMAVPPGLAAVAGYYARSLTVKYATLAVFAAAAVTLYFLLIGKQGRALERREQEILDAVSGRGEEI